MDGDPLVPAAEALLASPGDVDAAGRLAAALFVLPEGVTAALADRVLGSTGPFARVARAGLPPGDRRLDRAARELETLGVLALVDWAARLARHGLADAVPADPSADGGLPPAAAELRAALLDGPGWGAHAGALARFHHEEGCGPLAVRRVLRWAGGALAEVEDPDPVRLEDLVGGEAVRAPLHEDLDAFSAGGTANDALLYGPPGTGKSASARALAAEFAPRGLRLVQAAREEVARLTDLLRALGGTGPRTLVLLDDLVFDAEGRTDRALRTALEGDVAARPANVLVWATSNRLRLVRETRSEREDELEAELARGEKAALATRFGRRVRFDAPDQDGYLAIVERLVRDRDGAVPPGTAEAALRFARAGHGATPRTARQFVAGLRPGG
jgi:predicted AAA+ superfamily ATPase